MFAVNIKFVFNPVDKVVTKNELPYKAQPLETADC